jgi:hypothetical protein
MNDPECLSPLGLRLRETIQRDLIGWASTCRINLRPYQRQTAQAIKESILHQLGLTFVVVLPRQCGKNELQAHLFSWLPFCSAYSGGRIVSVSPTFKLQTTNNMERVSLSLNSGIGSRGKWHSSKGYMYTIGKACPQFFSADLLLPVDEAQEVNPAKFDKDFDQMTASTNATRVFWGTAWTSPAPCSNASAAEPCRPSSRTATSASFSSPPKTCAAWYLPTAHKWSESSPNSAATIRSCAPSSSAKRSTPRRAYSTPGG